MTTIVLWNIQLSPPTCKDLTYSSGRLLNIWTEIYIFPYSPVMLFCQICVPQNGEYICDSWKAYRKERDRNIRKPRAKIISTKAKKTKREEILLYVPPISLLLQMTWTYGMWSLKTMHLNNGLFHAIIDEETSDLGTLVSLELDDLAHFFIVDKSAVASEFLSSLIKTHR